MSSESLSTPAVTDAKASAIPYAVYALTMSTFAMGTEGYVYAGHLESLAKDMGKDLSQMGQIATAFAITYALTAPLTAAVVARFDRRSVLMVGLSLIGTLNFLAGLSNSYMLLIAVRIACGIAAGMVGPIASVAVTELVRQEQRGKALAIVMSGMTGAFVLGIPIGSAIGEAFGWRGTFFYAGALALIAAWFDRMLLPGLPGRISKRIHVFRAILSRSVLSTYALTLIGFASTFTTIAYIGPLVTAATGLRGSGVGTMQALIGIGSIFGIALGIRIADNRLALKAIAISFGTTAVSMTSYSVIMQLLPIDTSGSASPPYSSATIALFGVCMIAGAAALFSRAPIIQTRLVSQSSAESRPVLLALNGSMVFLGQGLGAGIGGLSIASIGLPWIGATAGLVAIAGLAMTMGIYLQERSKTN